MTDELKFQTLVDYYRNKKVENISLLMKMGMEQQVSFAYEWFVHRYMKQETTESFNFATYVCLIQAPPEYYGNYVDYMIESIGIKEEVLETCLTYIRSGLIPYKIWIDKLISDIHSTEYYSQRSAAGMLLVYLNLAMRTSLTGYLKAHKALCEEELPDDIQNAVNLAYSMFMGLPKALKDDYMKLFRSGKEEDRRKLSDYELMLFSTTLIDMIQYPISVDKINAIEEGKLPAGAPFWDEPMPPVRELVQNNSRAPLKIEGAEEVLGTVNTEPEETEFIVEKVAKHGSHRVMSRNKFTSKAEAENFIEDVVSITPSVVDSFIFTINKVPYVSKRSVSA